MDEPAPRLEKEKGGEIFINTRVVAPRRDGRRQEGQSFPDGRIAPAV